MSGVPAGLGSAVPRNLGCGAASPAVPARPVPGCQERGLGRPNNSPLGFANACSPVTAAAAAPWAGFSSRFPTEAIERLFQGYAACNVISKCKRWGLMTCPTWCLGGNGAWRSFFTPFFLEN